MDKFDLRVPPTPSEAASSENYSSADWWLDAVEEDAVWSLPLDGEGGLWSGPFVPPPPRPDFLDDHVTPDGLTTCDLCTWAWKERGYSLDSYYENGEMSWQLTLAIVSILSAAIGAIVMVTVLHCRRMQRLGPVGACTQCLPRNQSPSSTVHSRHSQENDKTAQGLSRLGDSSRDGLWTWLTHRRQVIPPSQLFTTSGAPAENHYTLEETYTAVDEALYAELDRESNSSPAYQNNAYSICDIDPDLQVSSPPSSAYYSDLSIPDRTYESVGIVLLGNSTGLWEANDNGQSVPRLTAISETHTVPSDYV